MAQHPAKSYILAIDLGTSGPKAAIVSDALQVVESHFVPTDLHLLENGGAEQDPAQWWSAIDQAVTTVLEKSAVPKHEIIAICNTAQWSGTIPIDEHGKAMHHAIIWMDTRGAPYIHAITGGKLRIQGYSISKLRHWLKFTGGVPTHSGKDSLAHILFFKHEMPELYKQCAMFLEPKDYLNYLLSGELAASYDSITLHWITDNRNIHKVAYHPKLLKMSGIDQCKLPPLMPSTESVGTLKPDLQKRWQLGALPVVCGSPDMQSASVGSGGVEDYQAHLYIGTSSWLSCHLPYKKTDIMNNMASFPSAIPGRYFLTNEQETAGACLTYLRDQILYKQDELLAESEQADVFKIFDQLAADIPAGSDNILFMPWLYGERTPIDDHLVRAAFFNLSLQHTRAHLIRAMFEGVAFNARWLLQYVEKFIAQPLDYINFIGGGANSALWSQIFADVLQRPINQMADPIYANLKGAAMIALHCVKKQSFSELGAHIVANKTFYPQKAHKPIYDKLFWEFTHFYSRNKASYARLNRR